MGKMKNMAKRRSKAYMLEIVIIAILIVVITVLTINRNRLASSQPERREERPDIDSYAYLITPGMASSMASAFGHHGDSVISVTLGATSIPVAAGNGGTDLSEPYATQGGMQSGVVWDDATKFHEWINPRIDHFAGEKYGDYILASFVVGRSGLPEGLLVIHSPNEELTKELEEVLGSSPQWNVPMLNGEPVGIELLLYVFLDFNEQQPATVQYETSS